MEIQDCYIWPSFLAIIEKIGTNGEYLFQNSCKILRERRETAVPL